MDLVLFEKWFTSLMPPKFQKHIHDLVGCIREDSHQQFLSALPQFGKSILSSDQTEQAAAVNGFLTGVAFCESMRRNPAQVMNGMQRAITRNSQNRGENIVSFLDKKAEKRQ